MTNNFIMKLQLKHLAPYLPYGLKVRILPLNNLYSDQITTIECLSNEFMTFKKAPDYYFEDEEPDIDFKPLLIPLDKISKECLAYLNFSQNLFGVNYLLKQARDKSLLLSEYDYLVENHFDVFGLIDAGLALNKLDYER